ncbi:20816_t:CDS:2 [Dentiscutata erythropus]|uniref:20816_t:CDS:1 n=1 Tax=Dentiscutata erythropus TaxID=1348616 RepID=A0A9N9JL15_9GLOM|nr:20816_t:CDS:2 [Dentiscutata erythropus]
MPEDEPAEVVASAVQTPIFIPDFPCKSHSSTTLQDKTPSPDISQTDLKETILSISHL